MQSGAGGSNYLGATWQTPLIAWGSPRGMRMVHFQGSVSTRDPVGLRQLCPHLPRNHKANTPLRQVSNHVWV